MSQKPLLSVRQLNTWYTQKSPLFAPKSVLKAVQDVSFDIGPGEVVSLVGESGCGKTTVGRTLTRLENATSGEVFLDGKNILKLSAREFRATRKKIQMIFQDPFASLNPRLRIEQILAEPLYIHTKVNDRATARRHIANMLEQVGLDPAVMTRYPHEFSGGQRQRIAIARVMIIEPELIIADEAVSALDVSIQAQVLNLIKQLQQENGQSMLFISHDLAVVRHISDKVIVMNKGQIVESGTRQDIFNNPQHQYTQTLLDSIPRIRQQAGVNS